MRQKVKLSDVSLSNLTDGDSYWRIDWLGDLSYPDRIRRYSQPNVHVMLSQLSGNPRDIDLNRRHLPDYRKQRQIPLPIGFLPILRVGDIWRKDRYVSSPHYEIEIFQDILIDEEHCTPIIAGAHEAGDDPTSKRFLLPITHHPFHMGHTRSKCMLIALPGGENKIIIPHMELARCYFGSSPALAAKLFSHGMVLNEIYDYNATIPKLDDGSSFVQLRPKMKDKSAADIARIALDETAKRAATLISKSIVKCAKDQRPIYAETDFPFRGMTTLRLIGKWLPYTATGKIFACYRIVNCTAPFPFESLKFFRDNAGNKDGTADPSRPPAFNGIDIRASPKNDEHAPQLTDDEPYSFLDDTEIVIPGELPFSDLAKKNIEKERQKPCEYRSADHPDIISTSTEGLGIGEGGANFAISPADAGIEDTKTADDISTAERLSADFQTFFRVLDGLSRCKGIESISFECPYPGGNDLRCSVFPLVSTETGRKSTWPFIDYIKGTCHEMRLRRRVIVARIQFEKKIRYLLEIERRVGADGNDLDKCSMLLLHSHTNGVISEKDIRAVLTECAKRRGGWLSDESLTHLHRDHIKHTFSNGKIDQDAIEIFVEKIILKLLPRSEAPNKTNG